MIELFELSEFLTSEKRERIVAEIRSSAASAAVVYGRETQGTVDPQVRKVLRVNVSAETTEFVKTLIEKQKQQFEKYFGVELSECEEPQFLRYRSGDFFVAHQDGNTPLIYNETRFRKISIVVFLNEQSLQPQPETYGGGELLFHGSFPNYSYRQTVSAKPGKLVAFRAETTHEVTPVERGERFTIVSWYR